MTSENILTEIKENNKKTDITSIYKIMIIYDLGILYIGDSCLQLSRLKKIKSYYNNASIDINTEDTKNHSILNAILQNNPYINSYSNLAWDNIEFKKYDLVICTCIPERKFLEFLLSKYGNDFSAKTMKIAIYSGFTSFTNETTLGFDEKTYGIPVFPINKTFNKYQLLPDEEKSMLANELFISKKEITWGNNWLMENGLMADENLIILIDTSSQNEKLLNINVYFELLSWFFTFKKSKVLIFDEKGIGKKSFYKSWLGNNQMSKLIFAENLPLRKALCLISSNFTRLIFGPSTGLLHCASGIFNVLNENTPMMIAYTGKVDNKYVEKLWWNKSIVDGIILTKNESNQKTIKSIKNSDFINIKNIDLIDICENYTTLDIQKYILNNYSKGISSLIS